MRRILIKILVFFISIAMISILGMEPTFAKDLQSTVEIGNTAPYFIEGPKESVISSNSSPTNLVTNSQSQVQSDTIALWHFDEPIGFTDSSINMNTGRISGSITSISGKFGYGLRLANDTQSAVIVNPIDLGNNYTIDLWVHFPLLTTQYNFRTFACEAGKDYIPLLVYPDGSLGIWNNGEYKSSYKVTSLSGWHHIASVGSNGSTYFYVDGVSAGSVNSQVLRPISALGNHLNGYPESSGDIDELRLSNRAFSESELLSYVTSNTPAVADSNTLGLWHFEENPVVHDSGPNHYDAIPMDTLTGEGRWNNGASVMSASGSIITPAITLPSQYSIDFWTKFPLPDVALGWKSFISLRGGDYNHVLVNPENYLGVNDRSGFHSSGYNVSSLSGWHHVASVASNGSTKFYIDGSYVGTSNVQIYQNVSSIGNSGKNATEYIGLIDEVRITGKAMSDIGVMTSYQGAPSSITFEAKATDPNTDSYYLAICKSGLIVPSSNGGLPTCSDGSWCISPLVSNKSLSSCTYYLQQTDPQINNWYAFACDNRATGSLCSPFSQGSTTDGSESPFEVNHPPIFTDVNATSTDPGSLTNFTAIAYDNDTSGGSSDQVKLIVCSTEGATSAGCTNSSNQLCASTLVSSNPSCSYLVPSVKVDGNYRYYAYIFDDHGSVSSTNSPYPDKYIVVNNQAPIVSNVILNSGNNIALTSGGNTSVSITADVNDSNGCSDISEVKSYIYRSGITFMSRSGCNSASSSNSNNCYPEIICVRDSNSCLTSGKENILNDNTTDSSSSYTCTSNLSFNADPTDSDTQFENQDWDSTVLARDNNAVSHASETVNGVEVFSLVGYDVIENEIIYGTLQAGQSNDPLDKIVTLQSRGNTGLDQEVSGTDMSDGIGHVIPVAYQKHSISNASSYDLSDSLISSLNESGIPQNQRMEVNVPKPTSTFTTSKSYWGIKIPTETYANSYSGQVSIVGVKGDVAGW